MTDDTALGTGPEFDRIRSMLRALGPNARGAGDDGAILDVPSGHKLVVSTDTCVENVHFKREWMSFEEIGYRATAAALSDLAAMAATPIGVVIAIAIPAGDVNALDDLARGAGGAVAACGTVIVGGDLSSSETLSITATVFGSTVRPLLRSGARPGDKVYMTGNIGGSLLALTALQKGESPSAAARRKFVRPEPRIREALWLAEHGATACIDISDGVVGDLRHVAAASEVQIIVLGHHIPVFEGTRLEVALGSGEEYELCVTAPDEIDTVEFEKQFGIPLSFIGVVEATDKPDVAVHAYTIKGAGSFNHFVNDHK